MAPATRSARLSRTLRSTGFRLAAIYAGLFAGSFLILFLLTYWEASNALEGQTRNTVTQEAEAMRVRFDRGGIAALRRAVTEETDVKGGFRLYSMLQEPTGPKTGNIVVNKARTGWHDYPLPNPTPADPEDADEHILTAFGQALPDGSLLLLGFDRFPIIETKEAIATAFGWSAAVMVLLAIGSGTFVGWRALRRIDIFNASLRQVAAGRFDTRLPVAGSRDEFDELARGVNDTLDRVEQLMASLQQVSSDIAHDLRTPLTRLRRGLETAATGARSVDDYRQTIEQALAQTDIVLSTFAALLRIAQIEAGPRSHRFEPVDLSQVCDAVVEAYRASIEEQDRRLVTDIESGVEIQGDRNLLTQLLANLVENALQHTPAGTAISLSLSTKRNLARLTLRDEGPGIPADATDKVLRRFYRLEQSRSTPGSGLGLALVKAIADIHGAELRLEDAGPGLAVTLLWQTPG